MMRIRALAGLLLFAASCTAHQPAAERATPVPVRAAAKKPPAAIPKTSAPEVRLFAGVQSGSGSVIQFCRGKACTGRSAGVSRVTAKAGSVVSFAVGSAPDQAALEVTGLGARRVSLATGTLMVDPGALAAGSHRLTLLLRWASVSATYAWDVSVKPA